MRRVYIAHPLGAGAERGPNRERAARWFCWAAEHEGVSPIAPWITLSGVWDESKRELGLSIDFDQIGVCHALWLVGGRVSPGMNAEAKEAHRLDVHVTSLITLGPEPPNTPLRMTREFSGNERSIERYLFGI